MSMQSHVDPCTFIVYMHIAGDHVGPRLRAAVEGFEAAQGASPSAVLAELPARSRQVQFHEAYHFWQGLRLPFLYRYAFISFRNAMLAFRAAAATGAPPIEWDIVLPEFARLSLDERIARSAAGRLCWGRNRASFGADVVEEIRVAPLDMLECAASLAEFQVTAHGDKADPAVLARWAKRNPAALAIHDFAARFLGDAALATRALLPTLNASFQTSQPVRTLCVLLTQLRGMLHGEGEFGRRFLAEPEPCRWRELLELWLDAIEYEAKPDADAKILGRDFHRLTLRQWVGARMGNAKTGTMSHPFLGALAERWLAIEDERPEHRMLLDQPGWVHPDLREDWLDDFTPPLSVFRFHLGGGHDRVMLMGRGEVAQFTSPPLRSAAEWRGVVADTLTMYGAVRRASGAHFDAEQRTCHHDACPHYAANLCNTYPAIPDNYAHCSFPARLQRLARQATTRRQKRGKH